MQKNTERKRLAKVEKKEYSITVKTRTNVLLTGKTIHKGAKSDKIRRTDTSAGICRSEIRTRTERKSDMVEKNTYDAGSISVREEIGRAHV